ncbi:MULTISPECIES: hypothetical protein [Rhizobium]|uniref:hypothetical protein n=1 Tax=Rhizobium TaxID=379 RepID=UPI001FDF1D3A|nr:MULTISPECIES: hypothetical protein [Rhizobium]MDF0661944.1 hypothetical protein [Rhizobium sp. BC49]
MTGKTILLFEAKSGSAPEGKRKALGPDDIFAVGRDIVWSASGGVFAGSVHWNGKASIAGFPHTECLVVVAGRLVLHSGGSTFHLTSGDSVVIGQGEDITAEAENGTQWIFCATTAATSSAQGVVAIDRDVALAPPRRLRRSSWKGTRLSAVSSGHFPTKRPAFGLVSGRRRRTSGCRALIPSMN